MMMMMNRSGRLRNVLCFLFCYAVLRLSFPSQDASSRSMQLVDCVWNVMASAQKPDFFFRRKGRVHLYRRGRQFSRLLAAEVCASAVVMLYTPWYEVVWSVLATHSIRHFLFRFPSSASPCAITFQLDSSNNRSAVSLTLLSFADKETSSDGAFLSGFSCCVPRWSRLYYNWKGLSTNCLFW